ncbi:hypothetical protein [Microbacterium sp. T2.11-28]|uniref:hypothetical protein n=1 Tax=unclassified Microbacterium TaxID=2609290 RepID=UPI002477316F|nr:hypothetical protein [Microbacterium sp. T2.11-28]CAI9393931.1 hypothetical protein MICABA_02616 [Microbacterium sp. T2.11-28]
MRSTGRWVPAAAVAAAILGSTGCAAGPQVAVPPGSEGLPSCARTTVEVSGVDRWPARTCDPAGSSVRFTDGLVLEIPGIGGVVSSEAGAPGVTHQVVNWGVAGVGAASVGDEGEVVGVWGSTDRARTLQAEQVSAGRD